MGYLVPLSGGIDSCATSVIVFSMCREVLKAIKEGNRAVIEDVRSIAGRENDDPSWLPSSTKTTYACLGLLGSTFVADLSKIAPQDLCKRIFYTVYMRESLALGHRVPKNFKT